MSRRVPVCLAALALPFVSGAFAQSAPWTSVEIDKLHAAVPTYAGNFGERVTLRGSTLLLSSPSAHVGKVHEFDGTSGTWIEVASVSASTASLTGAADISGDTLVAGSYVDDQSGFESGAVFVFERIAGAWTETARLVAPNPAVADRFGWDLTLEGDTLVVGAPRHLTNDTGSTFVFERIQGSWTFVTELSMPSAPASDEFGHDVELEGDVIAVGAPTAANARGACHVFRRTGAVWAYEQTLMGSSSVPGDRIGLSVSVSGDSIALGGYYSFSPLGAVYVFRDGPSGWFEEAQLLHHDAAPNDWLGEAVHLDGDVLIASARGDDEGRPNSGAAHLFERSGSTWTHTGRLLPSEPDAGPFYSLGVAVGPGVAIVAAHRDSAFAPYGGAVYVFDPVSGDASNFCRATVGASGVSARLALTGSTSLAAADLTLHMVGAPSGTFTLFFFGRAPAAFPFGAGVLCVSPFTPGLSRLVPAVRASTFGTSSRILAPSDLPPGVMSGDTLYFQCMFRDRTGPLPTIQLSDALRVTFSG